VSWIRSVSSNALLLCTRNVRRTADASTRLVQK